VTICSAASTCLRSSAAARLWGERATLAVFVATWRAPWPAARRPIRAERAIREVGMRSFGTV
jgi:hypothetical protein